MWFKNLRIYRFTHPFELTPEDMEPLLAEKAFHPCGSQDVSKYGWVPPLGDQSTQFTHSSNGYILLCAQQQDKVIPGSVIKEALNEKVAQLENKEARKVFRKEREALRDDVMLELLPRAFTKDQRIMGYLSPREGLLLLDASSANKAETFLGHLRDTLGSLPLVPPVCKQIPGDVLTHWLNAQNHHPAFELNKECELSNPADSANIIRCKAQDLDADEVLKMLESGKRCTKLAVNWKDNIECILQEDLSIRRLKFQDKLLDQANEVDAETTAQQRDQEFAIMSLELSHFCQDLFDAFGGLENTRVI